MSEYFASIVTLGAITAILVLGLNVRWGLSGQLDLGFYLTAALGAYIAGVVNLAPPNGQPDVAYILGLRLPLPVELPLAIVACGLFSLLLGAVALRKLRGDHYAIVTVAATIIGYTFISQYQPLFNGYNGLYGISRPFAGALKLSNQGYSTFFMILCLAVMLVIFVVLELVRRSPFGRAVKATRENEVAAAAFGRSVYLLRLKAYVLGGVVAGVGGCLLMNYITAFNPASWSPLETFLLYGALLVGGTGNNLGAIVGAALVLIAFPQLSQAIPVIGNNANALPAIQNIIIGLLIIVTLRFRPSGIFPELTTMRGQIPRRPFQRLIQRLGRKPVAVASPGRPS